MTLVSDRSVAEVLEVLQDAVVAPPNFLDCLMTLNLAYWHASDPVCGWVRGEEFEIKRNSGHHYSSICRGRVKGQGGATMIYVSFSHSWLGRLYEPLLRRYDTDRSRLIEFLYEALDAQPVEETVSG